MERENKTLPGWILFLALLLLFAAYLYGISFLPLRGEEANRIIVAYEMHYFGDYFNPTHLGEPYYLKPPLFNWVILLFANLFGWSVESARLVSIVSVFLTALLTYLLTKNLFGDKTVAILSALITLTLGDLFFFYGWLAEIDAFLTFLYTLLYMGLFYLLQKGKDWEAAVFLGLTGALIFLTKGFPVFYHLPVIALVFLWYFQRLHLLFSFKPITAAVSFFAPLLWWYLHLKNPEPYLKALWLQTFSRTPIEEHNRLLKHLLSYTILNVRQLLPYSVLSLFGKKPLINRKLLFLGSLAILNYIPYWISPSGEGRYVLIIFPLIAVIFGLILADFLLKKLKMQKLFLVLLVGLFVLQGIIYLKNLSFFGNYSLLWLIVPLLTLIFAIYSSKRWPKIVFVLIPILIFLKIGYVNYYAPWRIKHYPYKDIAFRFAGKLPPRPNIQYLPKEVELSLCVYLDLYTKGIVLRRKETFFITTEKELPQKGKYKILDIYKGWVLGRWL
jgi:4-amino-4-deoxy-L-arabinose transferase-like glycosyltransferase